MPKRHKKHSRSPHVHKKGKKAHKSKAHKSKAHKSKAKKSKSKSKSRSSSIKKVQSPLFLF
jgi:hypothetical protein